MQAWANCAVTHEGGVPPPRACPRVAGGGAESDSLVVLALPGTPRRVLGRGCRQPGSLLLRRTCSSRGCRTFQPTASRSERPCRKPRPPHYSCAGGNGRGSWFRRAGEALRGGWFRPTNAEGTGALVADGPGSAGQHVCLHGGSLTGLFVCLHGWR